MKTFILQTRGLPRCTPTASVSAPLPSNHHAIPYPRDATVHRCTWLPMTLLATALMTACGGGGGASPDAGNEPDRGAAMSAAQTLPAGQPTPASESGSLGEADHSVQSGASATSDLTGVAGADVTSQHAATSDSSAGSAIILPPSSPAASPSVPSVPTASPAESAEPETGSTATAGLENDSGSAGESAEKSTGQPTEQTQGESTFTPVADTFAEEPGFEQELTMSSEKEITSSSSPKQGVSDVKAEIETGSSTTARQTRFESNNTPGFNARLLDDNTVVLRWAADPTARGYNVYKQAEYLTTVFTTEFSEKALDGSYYYEIEAFTAQNKFTRIAKGLTVEVGNAQIKRKTYSGLPSMLSSDYQLVFSDEFNGYSLDKSKWDTSFIWGPDLTINNEVQYYVDSENDSNFGYDPFRFDGENLTIRGVPTPAHLKKKANNKPYLSGILTSYDSFKFTYGYAEVRAKMPYGEGLWPAFWLLNAYYDDRRPEIDIVEFIGHDQDAAHHTYHYFDYSDNLRSTDLYPTVGMDFTHDFHTFGALWKPGTVVFYVDGVERKRVDDANVSHEQMYVLLNLAMGGWWAGDPSNKTPFPADYVIDYVRVYQGNPHRDDPGFSDGMTSTIPLASDSLGSTPNHMPDREDWPEGYLY